MDGGFDMLEGLLQPGPSLSLQLPEGVVANAEYQGAAPSFPHIPVPLPITNTGTYAERKKGHFEAVQEKRRLLGLKETESASPTSSRATAVMMPTMRNAPVLTLTRPQLHQIMGEFVYEQRDWPRPVSYNTWKYEMRREAQMVLPFLYLGPANAARDRAFLQDAGITKVIAVRDSRLADARLLVVEHVTGAIGIRSECVDVTGIDGLLRALPAAVQSINHHMLHDVPADGQGVSTGKVLVFCETGNVRAPPVVTAYLMSMFGIGLVDALHYLSQIRCCISLDEEAKHMLLSFGDLLTARRDVALAEQEMAGDDGMHGDARMEDMADDNDRPSRTTRVEASTFLGVPSSHASPARDAQSRSRPAKRGVDETMDEDDDRVEAASELAFSREPSAEPGRPNLDSARYQNRAHFTPFTDTTVQ
ncbi:dual specificity protein phosphatase 3 [Sporothrix schenckii 1099-18]|uniref:Dual specificity protein phosphatase 3 n=1 Tax=Sporothrix schenckii 1099-18 TaxID=1397361 RepID=A0A0F2MC15_SPOSC|nr:dual specificity protein phosphatase 3 [Sporothrix schenckii 1099-18]KJR87182.1 dual specificity protein phosphatase 3 [Sporothrix schenckii 1099-18]